MTTNNLKKQVMFYIVKGNAQPIFGLEEMLLLNILKRVEHIGEENNQEESERFDRIGKSYKDVFEGSIKLQDNAQPAIAGYRTIVTLLVSKYN